MAFTHLSSSRKLENKEELRGRWDEIKQGYKQLTNELAKESWKTKKNQEVDGIKSNKDIGKLTNEQAKGRAPKLGTQ